MEQHSSTFVEVEVNYLNKKSLEWTNLHQPHAAVHILHDPSGRDASVNPFPSVFTLVIKSEQRGIVFRGFIGSKVTAQVVDNRCVLSNLDSDDDFQVHPSMGIFSFVFKTASQVEQFARNINSISNLPTTLSKPAEKTKEPNRDESTPKRSKTNVFDEKIDEKSSFDYFDYYGKLVHQQNMLQDFQRTATYRRACLENKSDFEGKVIMDVGCGSGILSMFAAQAGAKKVYAVEASAMAVRAKTLTEANGFGNVIQVVQGKLEEIDIPEKVDLIISEPMGTMLVNERMLETYILARDRFLKEGGKMFPSDGTVYVAPFSDDVVYNEHLAQCTFWGDANFHGVNLTSLNSAAMQEQFCRPVVDYWYPQILMSNPVTWYIDFMTVTVQQLETIHIPYVFQINKSGALHGLASWFDVSFIGSSSTVVLSTGPGKAPTHWSQLRMLLSSPLGVNVGQTISGNLTLKANKMQSYFMTMTMCLDGFGFVAYNEMDLKNPVYRYNYAAPPPPVAVPNQSTATENGVVDGNSQEDAAQSSMMQIV